MSAASTFTTYDIVCHGNPHLYCLLCSILSYHNSDLSVRYEEKGLPTGTIWDNRDFGMRSSKASNRDTNSSRGGSSRSLLGDKPHETLLLKDLQKQIRQVCVCIYIVSSA
jgi:hypothetical protein